MFYNQPKPLPGRKKLYVISWQSFLSLKKDYTFCLFCSDRNVVGVEYSTCSDKRRLGYFVDVSTCQQIAYQVYKCSESAAIYNITASKCQCGFFCSCTCGGGTSKVLFDITDAKEGNAHVGEIVKVISMP